MHKLQLRPRNGLTRISRSLISRINLRDSASSSSASKRNKTPAAVNFLLFTHCKAGREEVTHTWHRLTIDLSVL